MKSVLGIRDVYPRSQMRIFHPGSRVKKIPDPHQRLQVFLTSKSQIVSKLSEISSGMFIPDPGSGFDFLPVPDPGARKAPDPGSGSATLHEINRVTSRTISKCHY
jgi:hypothetical protein